MRKVLRKKNDEDARHLLFPHVLSMILTPKERQETILGEKIILEIAGNFCTTWSYFEDNNSTKSGL